MNRPINQPENRPETRPDDSVPDTPALAPLTKQQFAEATGVSDGLLERFSEYAGLLEKWQNRVNLVSRTTLPDLWRRHFLDSAQLFPLLPGSAQTLVDLGSGAGFPGLVLALLIADRGGPAVHLVEADGRKAAFLVEASHLLGVETTVHACRLQSLSGLTADIITARALSPLDRLLGQAERFRGPMTTCLFLKGENVSRELTLARKRWTMTVTETASVTHGSARILELADICRVA